MAQNSTYYAVTNVNGPISVRLEGDTAEAAIAYAERAEYGSAPGEDDGLGRSWVDSARTDLEDELDIDGAGMSAAEFSRALSAAGARHVRDLGDGWDLWVVEDAPFSVDDKVEGGDPGTEDYDTGRVVAVHGDLVEVAWSSGVRTRQHYSGLRPRE